jgi:hypothetical protein
MRLFGFVTVTKTEQNPEVKALRGGHWFDIPRKGMDMNCIETNNMPFRSCRNKSR